LSDRKLKSLPPEPRRHQDSAIAHDKAWELDNRLMLSERTARPLNGLKLTAFEKLDTDEKRVAWHMRNLHEIRAVFSSGAKGNPILLAAQWFLESQTGRDELLNYVQAMVVLEILLGDQAMSDDIGVGNLIRNRCAYLIGNTHEQRGRILRNFSEIYRIT
jgi:hypothetical protein